MSSIRDFSPRSVMDLVRRGFYSTVFQPIRDTKSLSIYGYEALLRGPRGTPLAKPGELFHGNHMLSMELIGEIDLACVGSAIRNGRILARHARLFINVCGETLWHIAHHAEEWLHMLDVLGLPPERVVFEVSENMEWTQARAIAQHLQAIRGAGIRIALDDVGTLYPWLYHVLWLEPDYLKVERSFVEGIDHSPRKQAIVDGLNRLAERVEARLIIEGIETQAEWQAVQDLGVPFVQGFWLGLPLPAEKWIRTETPETRNECPTPGFIRDRLRFGRSPQYCREMDDP